MALLVRGVVLGDGYVEITWLDHPEDIRGEGTLFLTRTITIDTDKGDYTDERDEVEAAVLALLRDALENFAGSPNLEVLG